MNKIEDSNLHVLEEINAVEKTRNNLLLHRDRLMKLTEELSSKIFSYNNHLEELTNLHHAVDAQWLIKTEVPSPHYLTQV